MKGEHVNIVNVANAIEREERRSPIFIIFTSSPKNTSLRYKVDVRQLKELVNGAHSAMPQRDLER